MKGEVNARARTRAKCSILCTFLSVYVGGKAWRSKYKQGHDRSCPYRSGAALERIFAGDVAQEGGAGLDRTALRGQIYGDDTEFWFESGHPFEIVEQ